MYSIMITYDTGDSFHQVHGEEHTLPMSWSSLEKAKQALQDIQAHYHFYMILHKEWNVDKKDKEKATKFAQSRPWHSGKYAEYNILLENDEGNRVSVGTGAWCGYFENLVGADIISSPEEGLSFRR